MKFTFISLFPNLIEPYFSDSILRRALDAGIIEISFVNPRDFSENRLKKVDDYMCGGGAGLLMDCAALSNAIEFVKKSDPNVHFIVLTPAAKQFKQKDAARLAGEFDHICLICGRYEGIDERIIEIYANEVFSVGDFVLTGGELPALCMCDAISRNLKNVLGNSDSLSGESFENNLLEAPNFTKPNVFKKISVTSEFLKGNHAKICALKRQMANAKTKFFRPDLFHNRQIKEKNEK